MQLRRRADLRLNLARIEIDQRARNYTSGPPLLDDRKDQIRDAFAFRLCARTLGSEMIILERRAVAAEPVIMRSPTGERRASRYITTEFASRYNRRNREKFLPLSTLVRRFHRVGKDFRDRQLAVITYSARQSMLIDIGQSESRESSRNSIRVRAHGHTCAFANPAKIARNLRENKIKMWTSTTHGGFEKAARTAREKKERNPSFVLASAGRMHASSG